MELGLIGFPLSGKTSLFQAITQAADPNAASGSKWGKAQVGVVKVPDPRLDALVAMFKPKKTVPAELRLVDFPAWGERDGKDAGIAGEMLTMLQKTDALVHVVRAFNNPSVPSDRGVNPGRDIANMDAELAFADLTILERRVQRLNDQMKAAKASDRAQLQQEKDLFERIKGELEKDIPIRKQQLSEEERAVIHHFQFLTTKPVLVVLNMGEESIGEGGVKMPPDIKKAPGQIIAGICAKLEAELIAMSPEEQKEFRGAMGLPEGGREVVMRSTYELLDMVTFFTAGEDECRAWPVERGSTAPKAARTIHSDFEKGFIRAEVTPLKALIEAASFAEAKKRGQVRLEGKTYIVQDGDVIEFLFNI